MIVSPSWAGRRYAVLGLARSGAATVRALVAGGAEVVAWDGDAVRVGALQDEIGHDAFDASDLDTLDLAGFDALVVSPGVPLNTHPLAAKARAVGVPVIGDIELFAETRGSLPPHRVVGITGTNGKSTTTALVHHILHTAGVSSLAGGNIGLPILAQEPLPDGGVYVLELSSYQLDLTHSLDCDVAVLLNVTPDHLDRYDDFEGYAASKARLFAMQASDHYAVVGVTDAASDRIAWSLAARNEHLVVVGDNPVRGQAAWPSLQGPHNARNAVAAVATCVKLGIGADAIDAGLRTFAGLPHRMERVATLDGVTYVDDSKATNPESAAPALAAYPRVHWIVGGRAKGDDLAACAPHFGQLVRAYAIGEAGPRFAAVLREAGVSVADCGTLPVAVNAAWSVARRGETVLLSPACASFDQFADYAARGLAFRRAVEALPVKEPAR